MNRDILTLIQTVNNYHQHTQELLNLALLLVSPKWFSEGLEQEYIVCCTTINSHYGYNLYMTSEFQNPDNHVDRGVIKTKAQFKALKDQVNFYADWLEKHGY